MNRDPEPSGLATVGIDEIDALEVGAGILGSGGGGDPRIAGLRLRARLGSDGTTDAVDLVSPSELPPDASVAAVSGVGAPTVVAEMIPEGGEELRAIRTLEDVSDASVDAVINNEIGGANSMTALLVGARIDLPVVDADGMGRAFPEVQMDTLFLNRETVAHAALADSYGNVYTYEAVDPAQLETEIRGVAGETKGYLACAAPVLSGASVREFAVSGSVSRAVEIGRRVRRATATNERSPRDAVRAATGGVELLAGTVSHVNRQTRDGVTEGSVEIDGDSGDQQLTVSFRNEFLVAQDGDEVVASVPDIITVIDVDTGRAISTSAVEFGQRVAVVAIPAPDVLRRNRSLEVVGPQAFGYDHSYEPVSGSGGESS